MSRAVQNRTVQRPVRVVAVAITALIVANAGACNKAVVSAPVAGPPPPPTVEPMVVAPTVIASWTIPATLAPARYLTEVSATLERDSAGRVLQEHVETRAFISLQGRRDSTGGLRANGLVDSFTVRGLERALSSSNQSDNTGKTTVAVVSALPLVVSFDAAIEEHSIRVITRPPLANECDRPESGATNLVRELLIRVPKTLEVGTAWRDSTAGFLCRLGVPITSRTRADYFVVRAEKMPGRTELVLRRTTDTQLDGNLRSTWRTLTVTAVGRASQTIRIDAATGIVQSIDGDGTLTVKLSDSSRRDGLGTQEVRQTTHSHTIVRP